MPEMVEIVDEKNQVVEVVERSVMRKKRLPHRASYIAVMNRQGKFLVEIRTLAKDYAPGLLDACVGGVIQSGEDPDEAASRELFEEVGIESSRAKVKYYPLGTFKIPSAPLFVWGYLYLCQGEVITIRQASEVSGIMYLTEDELFALEDNFAPDSLVAFKEILKRAKEQKLLN